MLNFLFTAAFTLGNIYKFPLFSPSARLSILDIVVGLTMLVHFSRHPTLKLKQFFSSTLGLPISLFFLVALVSLIFSGHAYGFTAQLVGASYLLRWLVYSLAFLQIIRPSLSRLGKVLVACGLIQYFLVPKIGFLASSGWDPHFYRVVGSLLDPGFLGLMLVLYLIYQSLTRFNPILWFTTYLAFILTYSRTSYLAFLVAFFAISVYKRSIKLFIFIVLLFVFSVTRLPQLPGEGTKLERTNSVWARVENWGQSFRIFADHPLLGVGFNTYRYAQANYGFLGRNDWETTHAGSGADSSILFVAATTGVLGLAAYLFYWSRLWSLGKDSPILRISLITIFCHSIFLNSQFYPFVLIWLAFLIPAPKD